MFVSSLSLSSKNSVPELRQTDKKEKRSTSWYTECGLFKNQDKRPNTFWYAEVGLYPKCNSTPSTSSAENSGNNTNVIIQTTEQPNGLDLDTLNEDNSEEYYNLKNENDCYNESVKSFSSSETKMDRSFSNMSGEMQLRLQDEPLYQFYNAAVVDVSI